MVIDLGKSNITTIIFFGVIFGAVGIGVISFQQSIVNINQALLQNQADMKIALTEIRDIPPVSNFSAQMQNTKNIEVIKDSLNDIRQTLNLTQ